MFNTKLIFHLFHFSVYSSHCPNYVKNNIITVLLVIALTKISSNIKNMSYMIKESNRNNTNQMKRKKEKCIL